MNIFEAYHEAKKGKVIKGIIDDETQYFAIRTCHITGKEFILKISADERRPNSLSDVNIQQNTMVCIDGIKYENYEIISLDQLLNELQEEWSKSIISLKTTARS